jgi:diguanylate cyclase (GGDEF)-like protein
MPLRCAAAQATPVVEAVTPAGVAGGYLQVSLVLYAALVPAAPPGLPVTFSPPSGLMAAPERSIHQDVLRSGGRMRQWFSHAPQMRRDRLLTLSAIWTALVGVFFFVLEGETDWQVRVFWLGQLPLDALLAWSAWKVFKVTTGGNRRFYGVLAAAGMLFLCGDTIQTALTFFSTGTWSTNGGAIQSTAFTVGLGTIVVAMLIHPHPGRSGRERLAFWLDSATVMVGGAVVAWCFAVTPDQSSRPDVLATLAASAVALTSCFAAVKLTLSGNAPMHKAAAFPMIASAGFTSIGLFLAPPTDGSLPAYVYLVRFMPSLLIAIGPRMQELFARFDPEPFGDRRRKPYSLLPYGSIGVTFGALVVIMPNGVDVRLWGVVAGLGVVIGLVALRQLVAFHDNTALITQLDATLVELRKHEARLRHQALFDGLTQLANRTHFHDEVTAMLDGPDGGTVLIIDLDGFKGVNDTMGHAAGDALLVGVADKLRGSLRQGDLAARLGGDEFAVLLPGCTGAEAEHTADRIFAAFAEPVDISGTPVRANASIGLAGTEAGDDVTGLLRRADLAMYAAKSHGKGVHRRYQPGMETDGGGRMTVPARV